MTFSVLLIGPGSIGRRHARNLRALRPDARFTILRGRPVEDDFTREMDARVVTDWAALRLGGFDLAVVASPSADHVTVLPDLIGAGIPLLVEKPVVASLPDCDLIDAALARAPDAPRAVGFNFRHLPSLQVLRDLVADGRLGRVVRAGFTAGLWLPDWRPDQDWRQGYATDPARGGGVELDLVHEPDVARWLFGELDFVASATGSLSSLGMASHDTAILLLRGAGAGGAPLVQVSLDYVARRRLRHYEIVGDQATALWSLEGRLDLQTPQGVVPVDTGMGGFDVGESYIHMTRRLLAALSGTWQEPLQTLACGVRSTRLALLARGEPLT
jgi:predicted dehydrogenase